MGCFWVHLVNAVCGEPEEAGGGVATDLYVRGKNNFGQLGDGTTGDTGTFTSRSNDDSSVLMGDGSFWVTDSGDLYASGYGGNGQLGTPSTLTPVFVMADVAKAQIGAYHGIVLMTNGDVYTSGENDYYGQLGQNDFTNRTSFAKTSLSNIVDIAADSATSYAVSGGGTAYQAGLLRIQSNDKVNSFTSVGTGYEKCAASGGADGGGFFLKSDGALHAIGTNSTRSLGAGAVNTVTVMTSVLTNVQDVKISQPHSIALLNNGDIYTCGQNAQGQLGLGDTAARDVFTYAGSGFSKIAASSGLPYNNLFALKDDGDLYAAGSGYGDSFVVVETGVSEIYAGAQGAQAVFK